MLEKRFLIKKVSEITEYEKQNCTFRYSLDNSEVIVKYPKGEEVQNGLTQSEVISYIKENIAKYESEF
jgi:hypothetical protein